MDNVNSLKEKELAANQRSSEYIYWQEKLEDIEDKSYIPYDNLIKLDKSKNNFARINVELGDELSKNLIKLSKSSDSRLYIVLLSLTSVLIGKYTSKRDVIVGTTISRQNNDSKLMNTELIMRNQFSSDMMFKDFLSLVRKTCVESNANQNYPIEILVSRLKERNITINSEMLDIFVLLSNIHSMDYIKYSKPNLIFLYSKESEQSISVCIEYNSSLYKGKTISKLLNHLIVLIGNIFKNKNDSLKNIDIISEKEIERLKEFNNTELEYDKNLLIYRIFEEQVKKIPNATAVVSGNTRLSYKELNEKSNKLARALRDSGVSKDVLVGLMVERSVELVVGILAILKAGGAYVPLDIRYPIERINNIVDDSGMNIMVCLDKPVISNIRTILINEIENSAIDTSNLPCENKHSDLAYVIYTSGSTGKPKGVLVEHSNVLNFFMGLSHRIKFSSTIKILSTTTASFDIFALECFLPIITGGCLVVATEKEQNNPKLYEELIIKHNITTMQFTPSRLKLMLKGNGQNGLKQLNEILVAGEPFPLSLLEELRKNVTARIFNGYGPSETTIYSSLKELTKSSEITIGRPYVNTTMYVVDKDKKLLPIGAYGELYIGGAGVGRGYVNSSDLNNEKYFENLFCEGERVYRTGDLAKWRLDGEIELLGRIDYQVKIRGYRIEIGEIEHQILFYSKIKETTVQVYKDSEDNKYLVAYYVLKQEIDTSISINKDIEVELKEHLRKALPSYMIPSYFVCLDNMPLTHNGKIDFRVLPNPEDIKKDEYCVEPTNEIERKLVEIWKGILKHNQISISENIFDLSVHSINAIAAISKINRFFSIDLSLHDVFAMPTIKELSNFIYKQLEKEISTNEIVDLISEKSGYDLEIIKYFIKENSNSNEDLYELKIVYYINLPSLEVDNFYTILKNNIPQRYHPHYIRPTSLKPPINQSNIYVDYNEFSKYLYLVNCFSEEYNDNILIMQSTYNNRIITNKILDKNPLSAIQKYHLSVNDRISGCILTIEQHIQKEVLELAFCELIKNQSLLRSSMLKDNTIVKWEEHEAPNKLQIPFIDISPYDLIKQNEILEDVINKQFVQPFNHKDSLLYRFVIIKRDLKSFVIIMPFDHLIYDNISSEIIKQKILNYCMDYESKGTIKEDMVLSYNDYIKNIQRGPLVVTQKQIIDYYQLEEYNKYKKILEDFTTKNSIHEGMNISYEISLNENLSEEHIWDISLNIFSLLLNKIFDISKIPIEIVSHGRRYHGINYYDTVGEFLDFVPILFDCSNMDNANSIKEKLDFASRHNINFISITENMLENKDYSCISKYLSSQKTDGKMILFNFRGKSSEKDIGIGNKLSSRAHFIESEEGRIARIICEVFYTEDNIYFQFYISKMNNISSSKELLNSISKQVMKKYIDF